MITAATLVIAAILLVVVTLTGWSLYRPDYSDGNTFAKLFISFIFGACAWALAGGILTMILALAFGLINLFFPATPPVHVVPL